MHSKQPAEGESPLFDCLATIFSVLDFPAPIAEEVEEDNVGTPQGSIVCAEKGQTSR
ncbi:hypothetical protein [uncultured Sphaerochaeta sp.]|uniref:hypothetical protein n=1 Tax=uncultured Sphaerochaeta sp. TaxID=886478 RepID=UPI002A0A829D|nr:hypothetical protein [uncultured Sphaerochaeta sp.]